MKASRSQSFLFDYATTLAPATVFFVVQCTLVRLCDMRARSCKLCQICMRFCIMFAVSGVVWSCDCWAWEIGDLASRIGPISDFGCVGRFAQFMRDCVGDLLFVVVLRRFIGNVVDSKLVVLCSTLFYRTWVCARV